MSALVFSHYCVTGNEGTDFHVGARPSLDPYDGFFDLALDGSEPGRRLFFLLNDGSLSPASLIGSGKTWGELRHLLDRAPMITGHLVEAAGSSWLLHVDKRETFMEVIQRKAVPSTSDAADEVARYRNIWESVQDRKRSMGQRYRFKLVCQLPSVSNVQQALDGGLHLAPQTDFGMQPPRVTNGLPLFLETVVDTDCVRVIALGDNDIDTCRVFDVTGLTEYRELIRNALERAELIEEINFWKFLLE